MKAIITLFLVIITASSSWGETVPVSTLRKIFHSAVMDASLISPFIVEMDKIKDPTPIELAYKAAAEALKAQEEWNPIEKLLYLKRYRRMITKAVELDIDEIEIRFLRFGIEYNIPSIFGFSKDMYDDKTLIIDNVSRIEKIEIDQYFAVYILTLLSDSGLCSSDEIRMVKSKIEMPVSSSLD